MAQFNNPIQTQGGISAPSLKQPIVSTSATEVLGAVGQGLEMFSRIQQANAPKEPSQAEVTEARKTQGFQLAHQRTQDLLSMRGSLSESEWSRLVRSSYNRDLQGLSFTEADAYKNQFSAVLGFEGPEADADDMTFIREQSREWRNNI